MNRFAKLTVLIALPVVACLAWAQSPRQAGEGFGLTTTKQTTLYQRDFIRQTVSLATGEYGRAIQNNQVVNVDSELDYGSYYPDMLLAGVQGAQVGSLYDLGTTEELALRYGYQETVGGGQGFASIHFENGQLVILEDYNEQTYQPFIEGSRFYRSAPPTWSIPAAIHAGHIYLVRIHDVYNPGFLRFAKLIVTSHQPHDRVTIAWEEILP